MGKLGRSLASRSGSTFQSPVYTVGPFPSSISRRPQTPRRTLSHGWAGSRGGGGDSLRWWWCLHAPRLLTSRLALPPDQNECIIANPAFVVYSSIVSFYVPFIVTLLVYIKIYIVLRRRRKRVNTKRSSRAFRANLKAPLKVPRSLLPSSALPDPPQDGEGWPVLGGPGGWVRVQGGGSQHQGRAQSKAQTSAEGVSL